MSKESKPKKITPMDLRLGFVHERLSKGETPKDIDQELQKDESLFKQKYVDWLETCLVQAVEMHLRLDRPMSKARLTDVLQDYFSIQHPN